MIRPVAGIPAVLALIAGLVVLPAGAASAEPGPVNIPDRANPLCDLIPLPGCPTEPEEPEEPEEPTEPAEPVAPRVGSCHDLTYREFKALADPDDTVPCNRRHTSLTVAVVERERMPEDRTDAFTKSTLRTCYRAQERVLGDRRRIQLTPYVMTLFVPSERQIEAGAAWVRCDVVLLGAPRELQPLPSNRAIGLGRTTPRESKCRTSQATDFYLVPCTVPHRYRALAAIRQPSKRSEEASARFAVRECRERFPRAAFYYEPIHPYSWDLGFRHVICLPERG